LLLDLSDDYLKTSSKQNRSSITGKDGPVGFEPTTSAQQLSKVLFIHYQKGMLRWKES
jgi:hypothetical protein